MRPQLLFLPSFALIPVMLLIVLSGCSSSAPPAGSAKKPETAPAGKAVPSPTSVPKTDKTSSATTTNPRPGITTVNLPAPVDEACVAAGGRLLVLRLKDQQELTVFDVAASRIIGHVPLDIQDAFAAGAEKLMVVGRKSRLVKRYSLADLKPEAERLIPGNLPIAAAGMGASSCAPLFVVCESNNDGSVFSIEPATLQISEHAVGEMRRGTHRSRGHLRVSVSADGSVLCLWDGLHLSSAEGLKFSTCDDRMECSVVHGRGPAASLCPNDRGDCVYACRKVHQSDGGQLSLEHLALGTETLPAIGGPYYLAIPPDTPQGAAVLAPSGKNPASSTAKPCVEVYLEGQSRPVCSLPIEDFAVLDRKHGARRARHSFYQRLFLLPAAQAIVELPDSSNTLLRHRLDLAKELQRILPDGPVIVSRPPRTVRLGEKFRYQIQAISRSGKPAFKLDAGPAGMVVSEAGLVQWTPDPRLAFSSVSAVISVADSGHSAFHALALDVRPPADLLASAMDGPPPGSWERDKPRGNLRLKLPAAYSGVCVGGNGRFLVFTMPSIRKVAVFDVVAAKIVGCVPLAGGRLVAAGMDKLVVIDPKQASIERFDLSTQAREDKRSLALRGELKCVGMGSASQGPVILVAAKGDRLSHIQLLDLKTLTRPDYTKREDDPRGLVLKWGGRVCVSADGRVFSIVGSGEAWAFAFMHGELVRRTSTDFFPGWMVPDETGEHLHTVFGIIGDSFRQLCRPNNPRRGPDGYYIPAVHGPLYLQFPRGSASLCRVGEDKPLASLPDLPFPELRLTSWPGDTQKSTMDRRVCLIPNAGLIVMLPGGQESVVLCRFDLDQILSRSGDDYLAVISCPPRMALPGKTFEYQLDVRSKAGKVECRLESGPKGMRVSPTGLVRWDVQDPPDERMVSARITVCDGSGKSVQHQFELSTSDSPELPVSTPARRIARRDDLALRSEPGLFPSSGPASRQLAPIDNHRTKVSDGGFQLRPGLNRQSMLFLQARHLAVLSADGMRIVKTQELNEQYCRIAERNDYYVAITRRPFMVDLLDKKSLATIRRIRGGKVAADLAIHPTRPVSYVTVLLDSDSHNGAFVVVDETTGEVHASRGQTYLGRWVEVDAAGHRLVAAGQYVGRGAPDALVVERLDPWASSEAHLRRTTKPLPVPHIGEKSRWVQVPGFSDRWSTLVLAVYDLPADGEPRLSASNAFPWVATGGLRLASDGRYAALTREIDERTAVNLGAFNKKPIAYLIPGRPVFDLAYHPTLPLVACVGPTGPKLFERETGKLLPGGVKYPAAELEDARFHRVWFSADGKSLLLEVTLPDVGRCLYRAELDLPPADQDRVGRRLTNGDRVRMVGSPMIGGRTIHPTKASCPVAGATLGNARQRRERHLQT